MKVTFQSLPSDVLERVYKSLLSKHNMSDKTDCLCSNGIYVKWQSNVASLIQVLNWIWFRYIRLVFQLIL